jgi:BirA family biotin operon repressor/biotin-[acetyl-CoA-carboxylase] ligase
MFLDRIEQAHELPTMNEENRVKRSIPPGWQLRQFDELDSTNDWVLRHRGELSDRTVVRAILQTRGRGRQGRSWLSDGRRSLTFSALHDTSGIPVPNAAQAAALALARLLAKEGVRAALKWPNDVLLGGCKVAGILAESVENRLVLGVGINLSQSPDFFGAIDQKAGSLAALTGLDFEPHDTLCAFLDEWEALWQTLCQRGFPALFEEWRTYAQIEGHTVELRRFPGAPAEQVQVLRLLEDGRLRILAAGGIQEDIPTGDLSEFPRSDAS